MAKEYFWGATLTKDKKTFTWDPEEEFKDDEDEDDDDAITHFLFLKQAVLGLEAKNGERNVVEITTTDFAGEMITIPLLSAKLGVNECVGLDIGLQPPVTFTLSRGSGPLCLSGQHAIDLQEDEDFGREFQDEDLLEDVGEDEEQEDEDEEEGEGASPDFKQLVKSKDKKKKPAAKAKASAKAAKVAKKEEEEEEEEEDEEEEEEEEEKLAGKGKKRPAPSSTGSAKKVAKAMLEEDDDDDDDEEDDLDWQIAKTEKDGKSEKKIANGTMENGNAAHEGDEDDDDDEEDEDFKAEDEEDEDDEEGSEEEDEEMALGEDDDEDDEEDSEEDEEDMEDEDDDEEDDEEEDEEEESSPDKPVKKTKGKVNGTAKKGETPKAAETQKAQAKSKGKDKKKTFTIDEMKQDLIKVWKRSSKSPSKPKKEDKFTNFVKSRFHITETKKIQELWTWYKGSQLK